MFPFYTNSFMVPFYSNPGCGSFVEIAPGGGGAPVALREEVVHEHHL